MFPTSNKGESGKITRDKAKYRDLMDGLDKISKQIQLLTGGKTDDVGLGELVEALRNSATKK